MSIKKISDTAYKLDIRLWIKSKEYRHRETFAGGQKAAKNRELEIKEALQAKAAKENCSFKIQLFGEALSFYLEHRSLGRSRSLLKRLESDLGNVPIAELTGRFDLWLQEIKKQYSACTVNRYLAWSKAALNLAIRYGYLKENPLQRFERLREIPRDRLLSDEEKLRLLTVVKTEAPHILPIVRYAMMIPSRRGELVSMRREWYDMVNNCIHIPAEYTKAKRSCIKPVPEELREYMRTIPQESEWIFYRKENGKYHSIGDFKKAWHRCLRLAEITDFRFHDARRGSYTALILAGNLPHVVQKISGHKTDMSKVYLNISNMQAVKALKFASLEPETGHLTGHLKHGSE